jgi:hypothetical protein
VRRDRNSITRLQPPLYEGEGSMESERIEFQVVDEVTLRGHPFRTGNVRSLGIVVTQ